MKFAAATLLFATAVSAKKAAPAVEVEAKVDTERELTPVHEPFKSFCCVYPAGTPFLGAAEFINTFDEKALISGFSSPLCRKQICPDGARMLFLDDLCPNTFRGPSVPCNDDLTLPNSLNCCQPGTSTVVSDIPWNCASLLGFTNEEMGNPGVPRATEKGYYCGPVMECKFDGTVCGDPHFQTWEGEWYDFHGECDMTFLKNPEFGYGLGLDVQIRTKARYEYSFVESAAVKIGDDVLEVGEYGNYFFNGVESADLKGAKFADKYAIEYTMVDEKTHIFNITVGDREDEVLMVKSFKDLVSVKVIAAYADVWGDSVGMLGNYHTGALLARDGKTVIVDHDEFGMEWQVTADELRLFQSAGVEGKCIMPSKSAAVERRRLGGAGISEEAARDACSAVDHVHFENCVYDVMATNDLEAVHAGVF